MAVGMHLYGHCCCKEVATIEAKISVNIQCIYRLSLGAKKVPGYCRELTVSGGSTVHIIQYKGVCEIVKPMVA